MGIKLSNVAPFEFFTGHEFMASAPDVPTFLVDPIIPGMGITLMHGSPGAGKSTAMWHLGQCVATGEPFLGLPVQQGRVLLICLDMNRVVLYTRWRTGDYTPAFDVLVGPPINTLQESFWSTIYGKWFIERLIATPYDLIMIDALGECFLGPASNNEIPPQVYGVFRKMVPSASILFVHHDRKRGRTPQGKEIGPSGEDALGSILWKAYAQSVIQVSRTNKDHRLFSHIKSQGGMELDPIEFRIARGGCMIERWCEEPLQEIVALDHQIVGLKHMSVRQAAAAMGMSKSTANRRLKLLKELEESEVDGKKVVFLTT